MNGDGYFFDSYALIELNQGAENYRPFFGMPIYTSLMHVYEFFYATLKAYDFEHTKKQTEGMHCNFIAVELQDVMDAARFKLEHKSKKFSYIDCLGYVLAKRQGLKFLTGDKEFKGLENVEFVK